MKKWLVGFLISGVFCVSIFAMPAKYNESHEENWSDITYIYIPVTKVLDSTDGYVVIYQKNKSGMGKFTIPKRWTRGNNENPRKLKVRELPGGKMRPYVSIIQKAGEFKKIILTVPKSRKDPSWGVVAAGKTLDDLDKETLEAIEM